MAAPQFGEPQAGRDYPDRPAAFAVVERDGLIALVRVAERNGRLLSAATIHVVCIGVSFNRQTCST